MTSYSGGRNSDSRKRSFQGGSLANEPAVEVRKEYELEITQISRQGEGIARVQGFVVFVKNGKAGQKAKVKIDRL